MRCIWVELKSLIDEDLIRYVGVSEVKYKGGDV